jgi:hypothetical protein
MRRSPEDKKRLDYEKQARGFSEYAHALRHGKWRRKRRAVQKMERQAVAAILARGRSSRGGPEGDVDPGGVFRKIKRKWGTATLRSWVKGRLECRGYRVAHNLLKEPYDGARHRARFVAVLTETTRSQPASLIPFARWLRSTLDAPVAQFGAPASRDADWLGRFLADEPSWAPRLDAWVGAMLAWQPAQEHPGRPRFRDR